MLFLLALLILGIVWVASALIDNDAASMESLYGKILQRNLPFTDNGKNIQFNVSQVDYEAAPFA